MKITIKGTIQNILLKEKKETSYGESNSQIFIMKEENEDFENILAFKCWKDKCKLLDEFRKGNNVTVEFFIKSNEYKGKWYTNLIVQNIKKTREGRTMGIVVAEKEHSENEDFSRENPENYDQKNYEKPFHPFGVGADSKNNSGQPKSEIIDEF